MVRVAGSIGVAVNGTLHVRPSVPFVGVEAGYRGYPVTEGLVDIDLAPTPRGIWYLVDFQVEGSFHNPTPQERWSIPPQAEVSLDSLRFPRRREIRDQPSFVAMDKFLTLETNLLRQKQEQQECRVQELEQQLVIAKERTAIAECKVESLTAEVAELKTKLYLSQVPQERVVEKVVEKVVVEEVSQDCLQQENHVLEGMVDDLRAENQRLMDILEQTISAQIIEPDEDVAVLEMPLSPNSSLVDQLDYLLRQQGA